MNDESRVERWMMFVFVYFFFVATTGLLFFLIWLIVGVLRGEVTWQ